MCIGGGVEDGDEVEGGSEDASVVALPVPRKVSWSLWGARGRKARWQMRGQRAECNRLLISPTPRAVPLVPLDQVLCKWSCHLYMNVCCSSSSTSTLLHARSCLVGPFGGDKAISSGLAGWQPGSGAQINPDHLRRDRSGSMAGSSVSPSPPIAGRPVSPPAERYNVRSSSSGGGATSKSEMPSWRQLSQGERAALTVSTTPQAPEGCAS
jgi:hypothetical protein